MNTIIALVVFALVVYLVFYIVSLLPLPEPVKHIVTILIAVIFLIKLLTFVGVAAPGFPL